MLDRQLLLMSDNKPTIFNTTKAVSWSHDNRAVLCCAEKLVIVNMFLGTDYSSRTEPFKTRVEETPDVSRLEKFSVASGLLSFRTSVTNLNEDDRQRLALDPSLVEESVYPNSGLNTFKHVVCSPICLKSERPQNLIAAVTYNHRVVIFEEQAEGWRILLDCSPIIKQHTVSDMQLPLTLGKTMSLNKYIDLVHSMCTVELEWSTIFTVNEKSDQSFMLLFTGTRSGAVNVWKASLPFEAKEHFTFQCSDTYTSEVTSLSWLNKERDKATGLLAVGYLNGSVRVLLVTVDCDIMASRVKLEEVFADLPCDCLAISDLAWAQVDKTTTALIGCKQYFLSLYSVCGSIVKLIGHYHMDVGLPLTSVSTFGAYGVASSNDGVIINFHCKLESDQVKLNWSVITITCMPYSSELPWLCMGTALSPVSGLCLTAHRINHSCRIMDMKRKFVNRQMVALSTPLKLTLENMKEILLPERTPFSPQDLMINLRVLTEQIVQTNGSLQDILEIYTELCKCDSLQFQQVVRDLLIFLKHLSAVRVDYQKELEGMSTSEEQASEKVIVRHVESCLRKVPPVPTSNELRIIKAMKSWISARNITSLLVNQSLDQTDLNSICHQSPDSQCAICGSDLHITGLLLAQCGRGHKIKLCMLTLLPCQDISGRKCESCAHPSVGLSFLSDVKIIDVKWLCPLCGGFLRQPAL